jgi:hypothetical protein
MIFVPYLGVPGLCIKRRQKILTVPSEKEESISGEGHKARGGQQPMPPVTTLTAATPTTGCIISHLD